MEDKIFKVKDLQEYLRLSEKSVLKLLKEKKIKGKKVNGTWRIFKSEVDKYLKDFDN